MLVPVSDAGPGLRSWSRLRAHGDVQNRLKWCVMEVKGRMLHSNRLKSEERILGLTAGKTKAKPGVGLDPTRSLTAEIAERR